MFNKNKCFEGSEVSINSRIERAINDINHSWELKTQKSESDHEIALKEKDFQLKHFSSEEIKKLESRIVTLERDLAVQKQKNEMLDKITDLNADVIDVKDLVKNLINKLPEVKISSLAVTNQTAPK